MSGKSKNNLDEHDINENVLVRILEAGIEDVDAGWRKFRLVFKERITYSGSLCHGLTDFDECTISLDPRMKSDLALETLIHELFHVILETVGLGGDEEDNVIPCRNEHIVSIISRGYMSLAKMNPELFEIIQDCLDETREEEGDEDADTESATTDA